MNTIHSLLLVAVMLAIIAMAILHAMPRRRHPVTIRFRKFRVRSFSLIERLALPFIRAFNRLEPRMPGRFFGNRIALANALGLTFSKGEESLIVDTGVSLPVTTRFIVWQRGADAYHAAIADGTHFPLGPSPDAPYQAGDILSVQRLGAVIGTTLGVAGGAIAVDNLVCVAKDSTGRILDLTTAGGGTWYVIGRAASAATAANQEVTYISCLPYTVAQ